MSSDLPSVVRRPSSGLVAKRAFDLAAVLLTAPLWLPLLAVLAILVRTKLGSPVLFRQKRPGRGERIFELMKFRTMTDARDASGVLLPDAERLTAFGRWLRASSLDELPELINVLRGDMSLVGPRPLLVQYLPRYTPEQRRRHEVPPGLTGWAQVNGRNALTWEQKFALDVWYVEHRTFGLDLRILFRTVRQVLVREGISAAGEATMAEFCPRSPAGSKEQGAGSQGRTTDGGLRNLKADDGRLTADAEDGRRTTDNR